MWGGWETSQSHRWCLVWASLAKCRCCPELCVQMCCPVLSCYTSGVNCRMGQKDESKRCLAAGKREECKQISMLARCSVWGHWVKRQVWRALLWKGGAWPFRMIEELRKRRSFSTCPGERSAVGAPGMGVEWCELHPWCGRSWVVLMFGVGVNASRASWCSQELMRCLGSPAACAVQAAGNGAGTGLTKPWVVPGMVKAMSLYPCLSKSSRVWTDPRSGLTKTSPPTLRQPHHMV